MDANVRTLYIENFPLSSNEATLRKLFNKFGKIKSLKLPTFPEEHLLNKGLAKPKTKGYAFIEFSTIAEAKKVLAFFNDLNNIIISTKLERNDTDESKLDVIQKLDEFSREIFLNSEFRELLPLRVMEKQDFIHYSNRYEEQRFQSLVRIAKLLLISDNYIELNQ